MKALLVSVYSRMGIRSKLILLFVAIKVIPLVLLALVAWDGIERISDRFVERSDALFGEFKDVAAKMSATYSREAEKALDDRAREELERLTTDTARAIGDFLRERDSDALFAAQLPPAESAYRTFMQHRVRALVSPGKWQLKADGSGWEQIDAQTPETVTVAATNPENRQDFHYRPPETVVRDSAHPLYHEITFVDLDGQERVKVSATDLMPRALRNVSRRENTYAQAERYFAELRALKPGELYVSDVIGPYVPSRVIGPYTPERARQQGLEFRPAEEAYAGAENPEGKRFQGIVRWATPVVRDGRITGYVTLALDHAHLMSFTDNLLPTPQRYARLTDASTGNYAFLWDYKDRSIAHPRHHSIVGFDPATGERAPSWLDSSLHERWQASGKPIHTFLADTGEFDGQSRDKKPAAAQIKTGQIGLDCRYLNFAPQCEGWHNLTRLGGSGSFLILWSGVWKLTTAATIPYATGPYGKSPRGFGYVTIGANVDDFHQPAKQVAALMNARVAEFGEQMKQHQADMRKLIASSMTATASSLLLATVAMIGLVVWVAFWLAGALTTRLVLLIEGLRNIERGDLGFRFTHESRDEMGQLTDSLNRMANSVQESFQRLEDAHLEAIENSRMKSDFLARMSHELRTPLNGILGFSELIKIEAPNADIAEYAETVHQSSEHLLELVNDILDMAKIEAGHMTIEFIPVDPHASIVEICTLHSGAALQKGIALNFEMAPDLPRTIHCDPMRLRQILNNLLSNAVKFTQAGEVRVCAHADHGNLHVSVSDTGRGIPPEALPHIFERFHQGANFITRQHGGTGLGLALVRELLQLMGGQIEVKSVPGEGSTFSFRIPLDKPATAAPEARDSVGEL